MLTGLLFFSVYLSISFHRSLSGTVYFLCIWFPRSISEEIAEGFRLTKKIQSKSSYCPKWRYTLWCNVNSRILSGIGRHFKRSFDTSIDYVYNKTELTKSERIYISYFQDQSLIKWTTLVNEYVLYLLMRKMYAFWKKYAFKITEKRNKILYVAMPHQYSEGVYTLRRMQSVIYII